MLLKLPPQKVGLIWSFFSFISASSTDREAAGRAAVAGAGGGATAAGPVAAGGTAGGALAAGGAAVAAAGLPTAPLGLTMLFSATVAIARSTTASLPISSEPRRGSTEKRIRISGMPHEGSKWPLS